MLKKITISLSALGLTTIGAAKAYAQSWRNFFPIDFQTAGGGSLDSMLRLIINVILLAAGIVAVIYLIVGGYQYITSAGNAEQAQAGRTTVLNAIIGIVIIFASFLIVRFIFDRIVQYDPIA